MGGTASSTPSSDSSRARSAASPGPRRRRRRGRCAGRRMRPSVEHEDPVGEHDRLVDVVGDEQDRRAVARAQVAQQGVHPDAGERVERAERLVEQQQLGVADQRPGQRDALLLAAGQLARPGRSRPARPTSASAARPRRRASRPRRPRVTLSRPAATAAAGGPGRRRRAPAARRRRPCRRRRGRARRAPAAACSCRSRCAPSSATNSPGRELEVESVEDRPRRRTAGRRRRGRPRAAVRAPRVRRHDSALLSMTRTSASDTRPSSRVEDEADDDDVGLQEVLRDHHQCSRCRWWR